MAPAIYPKYKEAILSGSANTSLTSGTVKAVLVDTGTYTYSTSHEFRSSLSGVAQTAGPADATITIDNKSVTNGLFETSDDTDTFSSVTAGNSCEALVIFIDTGNAATSRLVAFIDGLSITPNGGDITVDWSDVGDGFDGIFQL